AQYLAGRGGRHRARHLARDLHRHRAVVEELAAGEGFRRLCRGGARRSAAAPALVLVRGAAGPASAAPGAASGRRRLPLQSRAAAADHRLAAGSRFVLAALLVAIVATLIYRRFAIARRMADGQPRRVWPAALILLIGLPAGLSALIHLPWTVS